MSDRVLAQSEDDQKLLARLKKHPELFSRVEGLLAVVEYAAGDIEKASEAEALVILEVRKMGHESLSSWALNPCLSGQHTRQTHMPAFMAEVGRRYGFRRLHDGRDAVFAVNSADKWGFPANACDNRISTLNQVEKAENVVAQKTLSQWRERLCDLSWCELCRSQSGSCENGRN